MYYEDLSEYTYLNGYIRQYTLNVGWLDSAHKFESIEPAQTDIDLLWEYCSIGVARTRGLHYCEFCSAVRPLIETSGQRHLKLGAAEIRVIGMDGVMFAAPNLIFHYVREHKYKLPDIFVNAMHFGYSPLTSSYLNELDRLELEWERLPNAAK